MYLDHERKEILQTFFGSKDHVDMVNEYLANYLNGQNQIAEDVYKQLMLYVKASPDEEYKYKWSLMACLWHKNISHLDQIFEGDVLSALCMLLGPEDAVFFKQLWNRSVLYPFAVGNSMRSYRTQRFTQKHLDLAIVKLKEFCFLKASHFELLKDLQESAVSKDAYAYWNTFHIKSDWIAFEIDNGNQAILNAIEANIYSENAEQVLTREQIRGLLMSHVPRAHRLVGELLFAARLQEGLRQVIVETMDEGSRDGFIFIFKTILENDLMRFASVLRGFMVWTGIELDVSRQKVNRKCFETAYNCLIDSDFREECLQSEDSQLIYIALWANAFDEVAKIQQSIESLIEGQIKHKKLVALQFLGETELVRFRHFFGSMLLEDKDFEVNAMAVKSLFTSVDANENRDMVQKTTFRSNRTLFDRLQIIMNKMSHKEVTFEHCVFPTRQIVLTKGEIIEKMMLSIESEATAEQIEQLIMLKKDMSVESRNQLLTLILSRPHNESQMAALLDACTDRSETVRLTALMHLSKRELSKKDYQKLEMLLKYKSGYIRKTTMDLLLRQPVEKIKESIERLLNSRNAEMRSAGIEMQTWEERQKRHDEVVLSPCLDNGFHLFDRTLVLELSEFTEKLNVNESYVFTMTESKILGIVASICALIEAHKDFEYLSELWDGSKEVVVLGADNQLRPMHPGGKGFEDYPLTCEIRALIESHQLTPWQMIEIDYAIHMMNHRPFRAYPEWYRRFLEQTLNDGMMISLQKKISKLPYSNLAQTYLFKMITLVAADEQFRFGKEMAKQMASTYPFDEARSNSKQNMNGYFDFSKEAITYWFQLMKHNCQEDHLFIEYFDLHYKWYKNMSFSQTELFSIFDFARARELGHISDNEFLVELMDRERSPWHIDTLTNPHPYNQKEWGKYPLTKALGLKAIDVITSIEIARGELNTEVTHLAIRIQRCYGIPVLVGILYNLEKDSFVRGYLDQSTEASKKQILSSMLKRCYPKPDESPELLKKALLEHPISPEKLIDAAMYAPQWLDLVSSYLKIDGLKSACWYFHAHVNDSYDDEKAAIVARYSAIDCEDLREGAFDKAWFLEAYEQLGSQHFKMVYNSAKYIAAGNLHKRSQLFADAVLGKLNLQEVKTQILDKRSRDYVLCYGLIPLKTMSDVLERYETLQQFLNECKNFGVQRQTSERRVGGLALLNLAINAGYSDVDRLTWQMESHKADTISKYIEPIVLDSVSCFLSIDSSGEPEIICEKDGNLLRNLPASLKKQPYIAELRSVKKSLKDQWLRAREGFESAMVSGIQFRGEELLSLAKNPVLLPILKQLIFKLNQSFGMLIEEGLKQLDNQVMHIGSNDILQIAHPVHLKDAGLWAAYQKTLFDEQIVQPFKQVFRELYLPNSDEINAKTNSNRYSGHQVQPKKALALLKSRHWNANEALGIQKIYYSENVVVDLKMRVDWFTPSDVEAPAIEWVTFSDRKSNKPLLIESVSPLIFSEVMRDLDLVVSVAHVGGVDPEASLSTIEMRAVILHEIVRLMRLENVEIKETHAHVKGKFGHYTIHLGSGTIQKMGKGSISVLPVHSGQRGKLFLPFIDNDPKTAEIVSKIAMLSEDQKIKDPTILEQIVN